MKNFKFLAKNKASELPKSPGVYAFKKGAELLYIGKAVNIKARVKQHFKQPRGLFNAGGIGYIKTKSEAEALILEAKLIKKYRPKYNTVWKDDKNYFYVGITREGFPRIFITHQIKKSEARSTKSETNSKFKIQNSKIDYFGPFVDGRALKQALKNLRKVFPFRTCKKLPKKPCLWYQLGKCPAPCLLRSPRIEAYDISNIQGHEAAGSMVTFINGKPDKNFYRKFKIKIAGKPNDTAMIKEILRRRFKHPEWGWPDLILIDGGKAQLNAALQCEPSGGSHIPVVALAKRNNELYMENSVKPVLLKTFPREISNLLLRIRDEAHRFARSYHHLLRKKGLFE